MATNWPPTNPYPAWPPAELHSDHLSFSDIKTGINYLKKLGFTSATPTTAENNLYFSGVRCDHGHLCNGIMVVSPLGVRYPFAYCRTAAHRSALVLWIVGYDGVNPTYDLGWDSGNMT